MSENTVPKNVIIALAKVRETGVYNMFDQRGVIETAEMFDDDAANWLGENKGRYVDALTEMGAYITAHPDWRDSEDETASQQPDGGADVPAAGDKVALDIIHERNNIAAEYERAIERLKAEVAHWKQDAAYNLKLAAENGDRVDELQAANVELTTRNRALVERAEKAEADRDAARAALKDELFRANFKAQEQQTERKLEVRGLEAEVNRLQNEVDAAVFVRNNAIALLSPFADAVEYNADEGRYFVAFMSASKEPYIAAYHFVDAFRYPPEE